MPKLRVSTSHARTRASDYDLRSKAADEDRLRTRLIRECLRELHGTELIYAIRLPDGIIKIGHTRDLTARRRHFNSDFDAILAIKPAPYEEEQAVHVQLKASVAKGAEYYYPTPEVMDYINGLRAALGAEPIT